MPCAADPQSSGSAVRWSYKRIFSVKTAPINRASLLSHPSRRNSVFARWTRSACISAASFRCRAPSASPFVCSERAGADCGSDALAPWDCIMTRKSRERWNGLMSFEGVNVNARGLVSVIDRLWLWIWIWIFVGEGSGSRSGSRWICGDWAGYQSMETTSKSTVPKKHCGSVEKFKIGKKTWNVKIAVWSRYGTTL